MLIQSLLFALAVFSLSVVSCAPVKGKGISINKTGEEVAGADLSGQHDYLSSLPDELIRKIIEGISNLRMVSAVYATNPHIADIIEKEEEVRRHRNQTFNVSIVEEFHRSADGVGRSVVVV
jgi:hypothetical protein